MAENVVIQEEPTKPVGVEKTTKQKHLTTWQVGLILLLSIMLVSWLKQDKLSEYWQQTYQNNVGWEQLNQIPYWQTGSILEKSIYTEGMFAWIDYFNKHGNEYVNQTFYADVLLQRQKQAEEQALQQAKLLAQQKEAERLAKEPPAVTKMVLMPNQKVFFAGDSLMQGVAPWVMRELQSKYQIHSIDLSKQSTGLSYSSFFDWPATIEKTLQENPDVGVLVVFLGANDPWDVPDPDNKGGKYIQFNSPRWQELYAQKIQRILTTAKQNNVQVLWVTPPTMKKDKLNEQMKILTDIYHNKIAKNQALVIDSRTMLVSDPATADNFSDSLLIDEKITKVRTADGIHFTVAGQKLIAQHIMTHIQANLDTNL